MQISFLQRIRKSDHPPAVRETGAAAPHQKMKGVENILGDIVIEAVIQIMTHPAMIVNATIPGQKENGKDPPGKRVVAAENTQNIISTEAGTLPVGPIMVQRENIQNPGKRKENEGIENKLYLFPNPISIQSFLLYSILDPTPKFEG